ncbi:MAG TPA: methyltransferase domain-containing protein [Thermoanaerobaculia bacterium]|jgi:ubiquinone/menaquinone biosynthesis C-methylase UbiE|nr:methyltransferase domain-containing protein [Thermoanaerobaculia bacterium]
MFTPERIESDELLDEHDAPREDMERSLVDLRRINRYLGGHRIYRKLVRRFQPNAILDVGTGTSDLLETVRDVKTRIGLDFKIDHLLYLRNGSRVLRVVGDAQRLPFRDGAVDLVTSSHFFHHFSPDENAGILAESLRVARKGVAVTDTVRHYVPLLLVLLLGTLRLVGRITRYDAPASVRQGYTLREVRDLAPRVGASGWDVIRMWPFRFAILLSK